MMRPCYLLCLSLTLLNSVSAGALDEIIDAKSELGFLKALVTHAPEVDTVQLMDFLKSSSGAPEARFAQMVPVLIEECLLRDPNATKAGFQREWGELPEIARRAYASVVMRHDTSATVALIFEESYLSDYRDDLLEQLAWQHPSLAAAIVPQLKRAEQADYIAVLMESWMQLAPGAAMAWASRHSDQVDMEQAVFSYMRAIQVNPELKTEQIIKQLNALNLSEESRLEFVDQFIYSNPELAYEFGRSLNGGMGAERMTRIVQQLHSKQSPKAIEAIQALPPSEVSHVKAIHGALIDWGAKDAEAAEAWAREIPDETERLRAVLYLNMGLFARDPDAALKQALDEPPGRIRQKLIRSVAYNLASKDLEAGFRWVNALPDGPGKQDALDNFRYLAYRQDAGKVMQLVQTLDRNPMSKKLSERIFKSWAGRNVKEAAEWLVEQDLESQTAGQWHELAYAMGDLEPSMALDYAANTELPNELREKLVDRALSACRNRPETLREILAKADASGVLALASSQGMHVLVDIDPSLALEAVQLVPAHESKQARMELVTVWAQKDPEGLVDYLNQEQNAFGDLLEGLPYKYYQIAEHWAQTDLNASNHWVSHLPVSKGREYAEYGLAVAMAGSSPEAAFQRLEDTGSIEAYRNWRARKRGYRAILEQWAYYDPSAAMAAVNRSNLTAKSKDEYRQMIQEMTAEPK